MSLLILSRQKWRQKSGNISMSYFYILGELSGLFSSRILNASFGWPCCHLVQGLSASLEWGPERDERSFLGRRHFWDLSRELFPRVFFGTTLIGLMIHHDLCGNSHVLFEKHVCICDIRDHKERCFFFFRENASNLSDVRGGLAGGSKIPMRLTWLLSHRSCSPVGHGEGREAEWPSANLLQVILVWTEGT